MLTIETECICTIYIFIDCKMNLSSKWKYLIVLTFYAYFHLIQVIFSYGILKLNYDISLKIILSMDLNVLSYEERMSICVKFSSDML